MASIIAKPLGVPQARDAITYTIGLNVHLREVICIFTLNCRIKYSTTKSMNEPPRHAKAYGDGKTGKKRQIDPFFGKNGKDKRGIQDD